MHKAKIKKRVIYSVLFMRDDSDVLRFRMSSFWLKFLIYFIVFLFTLATGASVLVYNFWHKNNSLQVKLVKQEELLKPLQEQMGRLDRLNSFAKAVDTPPPGELRPMLQELSNVNATSKLAATGNATSSALPAHANATALASGSALPAGSDKAVLADASGGENSEQLNGENSSQDSSLANQGKIENRVLKVGSFNSKFIGRNRVKLVFDLNNIDSQRSVTGQVRLSALTAEQQKIPLKVDVNSASFKISYSKEFNLTCQLSDGLNSTAISGFWLEVEDSEGALVHSEYFPAH